MGSRFSKAARRPRAHKATASTPATSYHDEPRPEPRQAACLPGTNKSEEPPTAADLATAPAVEGSCHAPPVVVDPDAMQAEQPSRPSTESVESTDPAAGALLDALDELPGAEVPPTMPESQEPEAPAPPPPPPTVSCIICCAAFPADDEHALVQPCTCSSFYCVSCLKSMFVKSCEDLTRMPPRCCVPIPLYHARPHLSEEEATTFRAKYEEWSTKNPFYCPVATCSAFIPDRLLPQNKRSQKGKGKQRVDSGVGTPTSQTMACPKCETNLCTGCRSVAHAGAPCEQLEFGIDKETAELLKLWGYKRCPKCGNGVKRMYGCSHMECRCGAHFCWVCMQGSEECDRGCYEEDDYDSDEEPDQESDNEQPGPESQPSENSEPSVVAEEAISGEASVQLAESTETTQDVQKPEESTTPAEPPPQPTPRFRNLDGGSARYWEGQDLDFGHEPTDYDQDNHWDCTHTFETAKISLVESLRNAPAAIGMECMKCWSPIHPEVSMPVNTGSSRIVSAAASGRLSRGRGRGRGRLRGLRRMRNTVRNPLRADFSGSVPEFSFLSQSPAFSAPMEGVEFTDPQPERVLDTYGNTIRAAPEPARDRRASFDFDITNKPLHLATSSAPFSFAFECETCLLLVCNACKDALEADASAEDEETVSVHNEETTTTNAEEPPAANQEPVPVTFEETIATFTEEPAPTANEGISVEATNEGKLADAPSFTLGGDGDRPASATNEVLGSNAWEMALLGDWAAPAGALC